MELAKRYKFKKERKKEQKTEASSHPENKRTIKKTVEKTINKFKNRKERTVYHIVPSLDNKVFYLRKMGVEKPVKSFDSEQVAINYVVNLAKTEENIRAYINNNKGKASRFI